MEEYLYNSLFTDSLKEYILEDEQYVFINDTNNGNYANGQVVYETSSLANSGRLTDWANSVAVLPLIINLSLNSTSNISAAQSYVNAFSASLKGGYHELINSLSVQINNNDAINVTNLTNLNIRYKLLTSMNASEYQNLADTINFAKDTTMSINYSGAPSQYGQGEYNNKLPITLATASTGYNPSSFYNEGRLKRMIGTSYDLTQTSTNNPFVANATNLVSAGKNGVIIGGANSTVLATYYVLATIPLKFIHDLFDKMTLTRGTYMKITLNTHAKSSCAITLSNHGLNMGAYSVTSPTPFFPIQVSPIEIATPCVGNGLCVGGLSAAYDASGNPVAPTLLTVSCDIARTTNAVVTGASQSHPAMTSCRLYARQIVFSPQCELAYFSKVTKKEIQYEDKLYAQTINIVPGASISTALLFPPTSRLRYLIGYPVLSASVNGLATTGWNVTTGGIGSTLLSPYTSATLCPYVNITQFNVQLSGRNLYQENMNYKWQMFQQNVRKYNSINGGGDVGMSTGLLSQNDYEQGYGFIVCNLGNRSSESEDNVARSVSIVGNNNGAFTIDIHWHLCYDRSISVNPSTGSLIF